MTEITREQMVEWLGGFCVLDEQPSQLDQRTASIASAILAVLTEKAFPDALIKELAERRVISIRGSADAPAFDYCVKQEIAEIKAALTEKAGDGWQPIETAPKDGVTKALYGCFHDGKWYEQITKRGSGVGGLHVNVPTGFRKYTGATHWMPLPQPPALSAAKDGAG